MFSRAAGTTFGRLCGYSALSIAGALAALTVSNGLAAATPRTPLPTDDPAPTVPFDPGALVNAIGNYASLLSILTGGHSAQPGLAQPGLAQPGLAQPGLAQPGLGGPVGTVGPPTGAYPVIPGVPYLPGEP